MAARFWVAGGNGLWSSTTNWSATSGGASGASVPGTADTATFDVVSGSGTATVDSNVTIQTLAFGSFSGTLAFGTNSISLNGTGTVYVGGQSVTGTPIVNITSTGSTAITVTAGNVTEANVVSFNFTGGTYALTFLNTVNHKAKSVNFSGFSGTWNTTASVVIYGNLTLSSTMTLTASTGVLTFGATSGTWFITTNGKTIDFPLNFNGVGGTWQFIDALTVGSTRTTTLTNGTLDLNGKTLTTGLFNSSNSNTRTLAFGTSNITCVGSAGGTLWTTATVTGLTVTGTPIVNISYSGATTTTVSTGALTEANSISFNFTAGTYALNAVSGAVRNLNFTGFAGSVSLGNTNIYGDLILSSGMSIPSTASVVNFTSTSATPRTITTNGITIGIGLTFNGAGGTWQFLDAVTLDPLRTVTVTTGSLDLNSKSLVTGFFIAGGSATRGILFGTSGTITCNGAGGLLFQQGSVTGLTQTGNPVVYISYSGAVATTVTAALLTEAQSPSFYFTTGTYALSFFAVGGSANNVDFTGYAGTLGATAAATVYGNLTLSTGMTLTASTGIMTFGATSGIKTITTLAKTIDFPLTFNGVGGSWKLIDALTLGATRTLVQTNGTLDLNGKTLTVGTRYSTGSGIKNLTFNGGTLVCPDPNTISFNNANPTNYTTTAGTGTGKISMTAATAKTFNGNGSTFNCTLSNDGAGALTITGSNTFTTIANGVQPTSFLFTAGTTTTVTNWNVSGTAGNLVTIASVTAANHTLSKASGTVSSDYLSISFSIATGGAAWYAGNNSTNGGNNTGWLFSAPPIAYSITATNGTYALNGQSVGIARGIVLSGSYGSYAVTGRNITIAKGNLLLPQNGLYSLTGQAVDITYTPFTPPVTGPTQYFIEIRSFTESRRI